MGFLVEDVPLEWKDALSKLRYVREHGIEQFIHIFHQVKYVQGDLLRWGDEVEHSIFKLVGNRDEQGRTVKCSLRSPEAIKLLKDVDDHQLRHGLSEADLCSWMPEYGKWMLESTPRKPYEGLVDLLKVEDCMRLRRSKLLSALEPDEVAPTVTCMPLFGVGDFCHPSAAPSAPGDESAVSASLFVPDEVIFPHPRFPTLTKNIRQRRGSKVAIRRPRFEDEHTPDPLEHEDQFVPQTVEEADSMDHVYADAMAFGMGCCCLQITFQASNIAESRHLYDHLAVLTPMMLALTAATPFLRGWITDQDSRWTTVAESVDDRTPAERGNAEATVSEGGDSRLAGDGRTFLRKSRYDSIDCYLCNCKGGKSDPANMYNDLAMTFSEEHVRRLTASGVDELLAKHIAHLFARDPLVVFGSRLQLDDRVDIDHWESLQSTNWQTVRWKPPPPHKGTAASNSSDHIGWRVEFRSMELQITDFENAAFSAFVMLLSRVVLALDLTLYMPMSRLEDNMHTAEKRNAPMNERFWFRSAILPADVGGSSSTGSPKPAAKGSVGRAKERVSPQNVCRQMTLGEIFGGSEDFPGLIPLCEMYLDFIGCDSVVRSGLKRYMDFVLKRARGEVMTPATWMRQFVTSHPSYKKDSKIPPEAAYDLMVACADIGEGRRRCPELHGDIVMPTVLPATNPFLVSGGSSASPSESAVPTAPAVSGLSGRPTAELAPERRELLDRYRRRAAQRKDKDLDDHIRQKAAEVAKISRELEDLRSSLPGMSALGSPGSSEPGSPLPEMRFPGSPGSMSPPNAD